MFTFWLELTHVSVVTSDVQFRCKLGVDFKVVLAVDSWRDLVIRQRLGGHTSKELELTAVSLLGCNIDNPKAILCENN